MKKGVPTLQKSCSKKFYSLNEGKSLKNNLLARHGGLRLQSQHWEEEAGGFLGVGEHPGLYTEFQDSQGYVERFCLKNKIIILKI